MGAGDPVWLVLIAILVGMALDLAYPACARATGLPPEHSGGRIVSGQCGEIDSDPWLDLGGES